MSKMYDNITGRSPIATDDLGYIGTGNKASDIFNNGTTDYDDLNNKPTINSVELKGDLTSSDLGLQPELTEAQTNAVNSGITAELTEQISINQSNISKLTNYVKPIFKCGVGQPYTRLRDAIAAGVQYGGIVIVYPGTYDLTQEFATELATPLTAMTGIMLANDIYVKFMSGAFVTANFDGTSESINRYFSPFIATVNGTGFTLENAHIVASNCRYCVHDDPGSVGTYTNKYINCHMEMTTTRTTTFYQQAIGGGLGEHGTIIIDGGYYKSNPSSGLSTYGQYGTAQNVQQPITYHNGVNQCYGHITISNVYLADRGYLRFGNYGSSTAKTPVEVNNCSFGLPILEMYETEQSVNRNFDITAYNNVSRNTEVPFDFSRVIDIYTNSDDT